MQDGVGQSRRGKGAGSNDDTVPIGWRQPSDLLALDSDQRMGFEFGCHRLRKSVPIHGQRATGRHLVRISASHDDRVHGPHLGMQ